MANIFETNLPTTTSDTIVYTNGKRYAQLNLTACNVSAADRTWTLYLSKETTTESKETILKDNNILVSETQTVKDIILPPFYRIIVAVSSGSSISFNVQGREI